MRSFGYTLIEILVVLFIVSVLTSVALMTISHNQDQRLENFVDDVKQSLSLAEEHAMLQPATVGLLINNQEIKFKKLQNHTWQAFEEKVFANKSAPNGVNLELKTARASSDSNEKQPQIIIGMNGNMTPFSLYVGKQGEKPRFVIEGDGEGNITSRSIS